MEEQTWFMRAYSSLEPEGLLAPEDLGLAACIITTFRICKHFPGPGTKGAWLLHSGRESGMANVALGS